MEKVVQNRTQGNLCYLLKEKKVTRKKYKTGENDFEEQQV